MVWNGTNEPIAFLITFRCRATWLHGDIRGSVDRNHNVYGTPRVEHTPARKGHESDLLKSGPVYLDEFRRACVEDAIVETCLMRDWKLFANHVRTNHAHVVVRASTTPPERVLSSLKSNATRTMRDRECWHLDLSPWAEKGSKRWLWTELHLARSIEYVVNGQGDELPSFD